MNGNHDPLEAVRSWRGHTDHLVIGLMTGGDPAMAQGVGATPAAPTPPAQAPPPAKPAVATTPADETLAAGQFLSPELQKLLGYPV